MTLSVDSLSDCPAAAGCTTQARAFAAASCFERILIAGSSSGTNWIVSPSKVYVAERTSGLGRRDDRKHSLEAAPGRHVFCEFTD